MTTVGARVHFSFEGSTQAHLCVCVCVCVSIAWISTSVKHMHSHMHAPTHKQPHLTDVVPTGGGDWLIDHLLTHYTVECLLDLAQQSSLQAQEQVYALMRNFII